MRLTPNSNSHIGLFLTRDRRGKDPKRLRYFTGCLCTKPDTGSVRYIGRLADLGDDLYNLTFNGKPVKASWRTIYVVPPAPDYDSGSTNTPNLVINCNPASRFRVPRWLVARFIALQFEVGQFRNEETLQVLLFFLSGVSRIYVSLGSCTQHDGDYLDKVPHLWAKADSLSGDISRHTFAHDCSEDHIDSESWATRSKVFGDADREVRLSLTPSTRMPDSLLVVYLEVLGNVWKKILEEAGNLSMFPSLTDMESDTLRPTPDNPATSSQPPPQPPINSTPPRRPLSKRRLDSPAPSPMSKHRKLTHDASAPTPGPLSASSQGSSSRVLHHRPPVALRAHAPPNLKALLRYRRIALKLARKPGHKSATTAGLSTSRSKAKDRKGRSRSDVRGFRRPPRRRPPVRIPGIEHHKKGKNKGHLRSGSRGAVKDSTGDLRKKWMQRKMAQAGGTSRRLKLGTVGDRIRRSG